MLISEKYPETKKMNHNQKYDFLIDKIGFERIVPYLPVDENKIIKAYKKDESLNNIKLKLWDQRVPFIRNLAKNRLDIDTISIAECVCIMKACARQIAEKTKEQNYV